MTNESVNLIDPQADFVWNPLAGWANDDLMLNAVTREKLAVRYPWQVRVLDWPELRKQFEDHDRLANRHRAEVRVRGKFAIASATAGLMLAALSSLVPSGNGTATVTIGFAAALLTVLGGIVGFEHIVRGHAKRAWLGERAWTERLRQFYFQSIHKYLETILDSELSEEKFKIYLRDRNIDLDRFINDVPHEFDFVISDLEKDLAETRGWMLGLENQVGIEHVDQDRLRELTDFLGEQRLGVQKRYLDKKLRPSASSPKTLSRLFRGVGSPLTGLTLGLAVIIGVLVLSGHKTSEFPLNWVIALEAAGCALIAGSRVLDEGLRFSGETDLYSWYQARVERLWEGYDDADNRERLERLRDLEQASYEEYRRFILSHDRASFLL